MSRCQCMCLKPLFTTDMNRDHLVETRPMLIKLGPSMGARQPNPTTMDGGSAGFAGAKTCPAADGLSKVLPIHVSGYYLWGSSGIVWVIFVFEVFFGLYRLIWKYVQIIISVHKIDY